MKQGVYWVQRHQADQRAAARATTAQKRQEAIAQRKEDKAKEITRDRLTRALRLLTNVVDFFDEHEAVTVNATGKNRIEVAQSKWEEIRTIVISEGQGVTATNLNKFASAGKSFIITFARHAGLEARWNSDLKHLVLKNKTLDFS